MRKETVIKYVAYDGTEFNTEEECKEYEAPMESAKYFLSKIQVFDEEGELLELPEYNDTDFIEKIDGLISSDYVKFCIIYEDCPQENISYLEYFYGKDFFPLKKGAYRYDWEEYKWISYEEDYNNFIKNWPIIKTE
jgi:hypothetical protein